MNNILKHKRKKPKKTDYVCSNYCRLTGKSISGCVGFTEGAMATCPKCKLVFCIGCVDSSQFHKICIKRNLVSILYNPCPIRKGYSIINSSKVLENRFINNGSFLFFILNQYFLIQII